MKIYFAGSIRGGRNDVAIYNSIINNLKNYGQVLTEHIGDKNILASGEENDNEYIYKRDTNWIKESDILIAEVSTPSLGVGYEVSYAEALSKKIICLYNENSDKKLSAMIKGNK